MLMNGILLLMKIMIFPKYFNNCKIAEDYAQQFKQYHFLTGYINNTGRYNTNLKEEIKMIEQVKL